MILQRHNAIERSSQRQRVQRALVQLHLKRSLIVLLLLARQIGNRRPSVRFQLGFVFLLFLFRIRKF
jgi:hypothetical protein